MAVTSLWHVKGSIKDVIDDIENPEKTLPGQDMQDFFDVFSYVKNPLKTNEGVYRMARLPELQARRGNGRTVP